MRRIAHCGHCLGQATELQWGGKRAICHKDRSPRWFLARVGRQRRRLLYLDLREQVGADREQDRGETVEDREVGRDAEHETAAERAAP
jgi:hypothetical protein